MIDRGKVIKGLECCLRAPSDNCPNCPYEETSCRELKMDALALLKAEENAKTVVNVPRFVYCPNCGAAVEVKT